MRKLVPLAILGCLAFGPGAAEAATLTEYDAVIEGTGTWQRHDAIGGGAGSYERQATFSWKTTLPGVLFSGKELRQTSPLKISTGAAEARDDMVLNTPNGTLAGSCTGGPAVARAGELGRALIPADGGKEALDIRVLGGLEGHRVRPALPAVDERVGQLHAALEGDGHVHADATGGAGRRRPRRQSPTWSPSPSSSTTSSSPSGAS